MIDNSFEMLRPACGLEILHLNSTCYVQLGLSVLGKSEIPKLINGIVDKTLGLKLSSKDFCLFDAKTSPSIISMPNNLKTLQESIEWMSTNHPLQQEQSLGIIGANDKHIVLNLSHAMGDGVFTTNLAQDLSTYSNRTTILPKTPVQPTEYFAKEIEETKTPNLLVSTDPSISRFISKNPSTVPNKHVFSKHFRMPLDELMCYCKESGKLKRASENMWMATTLTNAAMCNILDNLGVSICVNLRQFMKPQDVNYGICNFVSSVSAYTKAKPYDTVKDAMDRIRASFNKRIEAGDCYRFLRAIDNCCANGGVTDPIPPGAGIEVSSLGQYNLGGPIDDCIFNLVADGDIGSASISMMTYTVNAPTHRDFAGVINYLPGDISHEECQKFVDGIKFTLRNIPENASLQDAVKLIQKNVL